MSEIEKARKKLQIVGYEHPTNTDGINVSSKHKLYKTFNTETKHKQYLSSSHVRDYATFTEKNTKQLGMTCPDCGNVALYECDCRYKDKQCGKGHIWHINKDGKIIVGDPHN